MIVVALLALLGLFGVWLVVWLAWTALKAALWVIGGSVGLAVSLIGLAAGAAVLGCFALLALLLMPLAGLLLAPLLLPVLLVAAVAWLLTRQQPARCGAGR